MTRSKEAVIQELFAQLDRVQTLMDEQKYAEAKPVIEALDRDANAVGHASPYLSWLLGVATDYAGAPDQALLLFEEALQRDPLGWAYLRSRNIAAGRIRSWLGSDAHPVDDSEVPRLYGLLLERNLLDLPCHLAMASWYEAACSFGEALRLLTAVEVLHPNEPRVVEGIARCKRKLGSSPLATSWTDPPAPGQA